MKKESKVRDYDDSTMVLKLKRKTIWFSFEAMLDISDNEDADYLEINPKKWVVTYSYEKAIIPHRHSEGEKTIDVPSGGWKIFRSKEKAIEFCTEYFTKKFGAPVKKITNKNNDSKDKKHTQQH